MFGISTLVDLLWLKSLSFCIRPHNNHGRIDHHISYLLWLGGVLCQDIESKWCRMVLLFTVYLTSFGSNYCVTFG
jgi:hypothetical protein